LASAAKSAVRETPGNFVEFSQVNRVKDEHLQRNLSTRDCWDGYAHHRSVVTELLVRSSRSDDGALCVLGAGNCNDLDLQKLLHTFSEIHLVDLDDEAISEGVNRQLPGEQPQLHQHGHCDITGVTHLLANWSADSVPTNDELDACLAELAQVPQLGLPSNFDVVASVCVLTQLFDSVVGTLGESHPRFVEFITAIRTQHLQLMLNLLRPGGTGVLITDIVASTTLPQLLTIPDADLLPTISRAINERNFFTGTNPAILESLFRTHPAIAPQVTRIRHSPPWRWQLLNKVHAVYAIEVTRR
jgi:hypothetical protein